MDKETALHNIASIASRLYVESNSPEYKIRGYSGLVSDLTEKYVEAYTQAKKELPTPETSNMKYSDKPFIKM